MNTYSDTTYFGAASNRISGSTVTIFDGGHQPRIIQLDSYRKPQLFFGRDTGNDIVLTSPLVSSRHGCFAFNGKAWYIQDKAAYGDKSSTNGLIYNNSYIISKSVSDGDFIRIDDRTNTVSQGVLFVFSSAVSDKWYTFPLHTAPIITIGRSSDCNIILPHVSVSKHHARIVRENDGFYIYDSNSTNGVILNNKRVNGRAKLHEKDVIAITNSKLIFTSSMLYFCYYKSGISVDATDIVVRRGKGKKSFITSNHVNVNVKPGELIAIIGGSGAGKSTILNCMCGYLHPTHGDVFINGVNLYNHFDSIKKLIGYVPQSDIVYDNLTLHDMLLYTAKLRLPQDISPAEREASIERAINMVELSDKRNSHIRNLSGGQRKRASIAVELLSDPNLLFLDEPASGLDPGTERNLMISLRKMAYSGKTVILVTHSTLQLKMCDKIMFMGKGGNLCFFGSYNEALRFFGVNDIVDIYNMITEQSAEWSARFERTRPPKGKVNVTTEIANKSNENIFRQLSVLSQRYMKLVINDMQRFLLLLAQAPLLAMLISFVANGKQFEQYEMTKSLLFALSCSAFWVGMLNAIQEICKERTILKREFMTGLSLSAYVLSKIFVLGLMCFVQSFLIMGVFAISVGLPNSGLILDPFSELLITTFITAIASTAMGLFVSSLFTNADRAMTVAPILLMPQILFSGLIFKLSGATEVISWFAVCRWSMEGYGTTANLNLLPLRLQQEGIMIPHDAESFFDFTEGHLLAAWAILILFAVIFLTLARIVLTNVGKDNS